MLSAFGVEHDGIEKRAVKSEHELIQGKIKAQKTKHRAEKVEDASAVAVGGTGAALGASALRNSYYTDYPAKKIAHEASLAAMKPGVKRSLTNFALHAKPRFPVYVGATVAGGAGFIASQKKRGADRKIKNYNAQLNKAYDPEAKRQRRLKFAEIGSTGAAVGLTGGAVHQYKNKSKEEVRTQTRVKGKYGSVEVKSVPKPHGGKGLAVAGAGTAVLAAGVHHHRKNQGKTYAGWYDSSKPQRPRF